MDKKMAQNLLKQLNKKTKKEWTLQDIKSLAKGFSAVDIYDADRTEKLIKKVADAAGIKLSGSKLQKVKKKVSDKLSSMKK
ncbi:hypothetical protein BSNK01_13060 [Bacillaceae bacterium]